MLVKMFDQLGNGRAVPILCHDDGTIVKGQVETEFHSGRLRGRPYVTVTLIIDGKDNRSE